MRKILVSLVCLVSIVNAAKADEGMWTLYNLPPAVFQQMQQYGFQLSPEQLYKSDDAVKNAVVNFGGYCSGVVVSPDGLVFTNHHCGFDAIRRHSTVEHDYLLNGFYAKSFEEELPNEDLFVSFMVEQKDVTDQVMKYLKGISINKQGKIVDSLENAWQKEIKKQDSTLRVEVKPFYEGNKYYQTTYRDFNDVRLVFTVPKSMGSLVVRRTTGCGLVRPVTSACSVSTPTPRPVDLLSIRKIMFPIIRSHGLQYRCRAISLATSV